MAKEIEHLLREGAGGEGEWASLAAHVRACPECLEELFAAAELAAGGSGEWESILLSRGYCALCQAHLPEYAEEEEEAAREKYSWIWKHLERCDACREQEELLRRLLASEEAAEPLPLAIPVAVSERPGGLVLKVLRTMRVFWRGGKAELSFGGKAAEPGAGFQAAFVSGRAWAPAYLAGEEGRKEAVEALWELPGGPSLTLAVVPGAQGFDLAAAVRSEDRSQFTVKLFRTEEASRFPVLARRLAPGASWAVPGLRDGRYELRVEAAERSWEVPLVLGQEEGRPFQSESLPGRRP